MTQTTTTTKAPVKTVNRFQQIPRHIETPSRREFLKDVTINAVRLGAVGNFIMQPISSQDNTTKGQTEPVKNGAPVGPMLNLTSLAGGYFVGFKGEQKNIDKDIARGLSNDEVDSQNFRRTVVKSALGLTLSAVFDGFARGKGKRFDAEPATLRHLPSSVAAGYVLGAIMPSFLLPKSK